MAAYAIGAIWSVDTSWSDSSGGAPRGAKPQSGEATVFDANSVGMDVNENTANLGGLDMTGYTGAFAIAAGVAVDVDGDATLAGTLTTADTTGGISVTGLLTTAAAADFSGFTGTITHDGTSGTPTLTTNGVTLPNFVVNNAGVTSFTLQDAAACADLTLTAGKLDLGEHEFEFSGDGAFSGGAVTASGAGRLKATGTGDLAAATVTLPNVYIGASTKTTSLTAMTYMAKCEIGPGAVDGAGVLRLEPTAANYLTVDPAATVTLGAGGFRITNCDSLSNGGFRLSNLIEAWFYPGTSKVLTFTGDVDLGAAGIYMFLTNLTMSAGARLTATGTITLGWKTSGGWPGILTLGAGRHKLGPIAMGKQDDTVNSEINFDSSYVELGGTLAADPGGVNPTRGKIVAASTAAHVHGGQIDDLVVTGALTTDGTVDGGGNTGVTFDDRVPGEEMMMGA